MTKNKPSGSDRFLVPCLLFLCFVLILPATLAAQTTPSTAVVMVEIQCKRGMAEQYREALEKQIFPAIREAIQKGDVFTNFTYLEAPVPAQDIDFVLIFEAKSFGSLDTRRIPPRLITTPKALSNIRVKHELGFQPRYPSYSEGLEETLCGIPHHT